MSLLTPGKFLRRKESIVMPSFSMFSKEVKLSKSAPPEIKKTKQVISNRPFAITCTLMIQLHSVFLLLIYVYLGNFGMKVKVLVAQLCPALCNPMDCSLPGSSVHGVLQARLLEWVAMPSARGSSQPRDQTWVCLLCRQILDHLK